MAVTPDDIAVELGRAAPSEGSDQFKQWAAWIQRAYRAIERRATRMGVDRSSLDETDVDEVVTYIVKRQASSPADGAEQTTDSVRVDDAASEHTRRYRSGYGDAWVLDEWWDILGLAESPLDGGWSGSVPYARGY